MTVAEYDRDTVAYLAATGVSGSLLHRVERLTVEVSDLSSALARAEATHPARLLGVAQVAIETALTLPPEQIHAHLTEVLARIKNPEATA